MADSGRSWAPEHARGTSKPLGHSAGRCGVQGGGGGADRRGQAARERRRWPLRAGPEAARAARGGGERDAGLRGKREGGSRAGLLALGELGQSGLDRRWALAGKGRKVGPDRVFGPRSGSVGWAAE